jgi:hypothetical protein
VQALCCAIEVVLVLTNCQNAMSSSSNRDRGDRRKNNRRGTAAVTNNHDEESDTDDQIVPTDMDVLCGRGRTYFHHPGNVQFREIVGHNLGVYLDASSSKKNQKTMIINRIANEAMGKGVRFLARKSNSKPWYVIGENKVRDKVSTTGHINIKNWPVPAMIGSQNTSYSHILISNRLLMH